MDFSSFLVQQGLLIAAGLYILGILLKRIPLIPDWLIPLILAAAGISAAGFSMDGGFSVNNILQGIFATGLAVLSNQTVKQLKAHDPGDAFADMMGNREQTALKIFPGVHTEHLGIEPATLLNLEDENDDEGEK